MPHPPYPAHNPTLYTLPPQGTRPVYRGDDIVDLDVGEIISILGRNIILILLLTALGIGLATVLSKMQKPSFTAKAIVLIDNSGIETGVPAFIRNLIPQGRFSNALILSELEVLRSRMLGKIVVQSLDLTQDPEFTLGLSSGLDINSLRPVELTDRTITQLLRHLSVRAIPGSSAVRVEFTSQESEKAAYILNGLVDSYIEMRMHEKMRASEQVGSWVDNRLKALREDLKSSEAAIQKYKQDNKILEGKGGLMSAEQLSALNNRLIAAQADLIDISVRLDQIRDMKADSSNILSLPSLASSPIINRLRGEEIALERQEADLAMRYGSLHPKMIQARTDLTTIRASLDAEINTIIANLEHEKQLTQGRIDSMQSEMQKASRQNIEDFTALGELRALEREATAARMIYDKLLSTYSKTEASNVLEKPDVRVISRAVPPLISNTPNGQLLQALGGFFGLCIGIFIAIALERANNSFKTPDQLERALALPCLGSIPEQMSAAVRPAITFSNARPLSQRRPCAHCVSVCVYARLA